jgi:hypothetical protein
MDLSQGCPSCSITLGNPETNASFFCVPR